MRGKKKEEEEKRRGSEGGRQREGKERRGGGEGGREKRENGKELGSKAQGKEVEIKSVYLTMAFRFHAYSSLRISL